VCVVFRMMQYVTQTALAFIAFSAGSELYLPELRSLLRTIALITGFNALFSYVFCTLFIYLISAAGVIPWITPYMGSCAFSISMVAGSIMVARSPASAIAVVRELRAKGPATSIMLGVTVVGDVVVLILFTLSNSFALALCGGGGFDGGAFFITILTLGCAVGLGYALGFFLIFLLWIPPVKITSTLSIPIPAKFTIIPLGFLIFVTCDWIVMWTEHHWGVSRERGV
jgi:NhaP-type Na+/H+ or K+/H+ antiporter